VTGVGELSISTFAKIIASLPIVWEMVSANQNGQFILHDCLGL
jgi:hypothetical protein